MDNHRSYNFLQLLITFQAAIEKGLHIVIKPSYCVPRSRHLLLLTVEQHPEQVVQILSVLLGWCDFLQQKDNKTCMIHLYDFYSRVVKINSLAHSLLVCVILHNLWIKITHAHQPWSNLYVQMTKAVENLPGLSILALPMGIKKSGLIASSDISNCAPYMTSFSRTTTIYGPGTKQQEKKRIHNLKYRLGKQG